MFKIAWRGVRHNTGRYIATLIAIITGVAFFAATGFLGDRVIDSLEGDTQRQYGEVDLAIVLEDSDSTAIQFEGELRLPAAVGQQAAAVDGVEASAFVLTGSMAIDHDNEDPDTAVGRLWITDDALNPLELEAGRGPAEAGEVAIDTGTADDNGVELGDTINVLSFNGSDPVTVVGITRFGDSDSIDPDGTISIPQQVAFAWLSDGTEEYQEVYLRATASQSDLQADVSPLLPSGFRAQLGEEFLQDKIDEIGQFGTILKRALQGFAILALLVAPS